MKKSFHGRTLATLTATGQEKVQKGFAPLPEGFAYAEFNNLESCRAAVTDKTAAILVEAVQGEGGIIPADPSFMEGLRALCDEKDILMLCDEVQCGMGRTGHWFGYQAYNAEPDAISVAKALAGGVPMGAIAAGPKLADIFQPGTHATTFGGTPLACAAALAVFEVIESEGLLENAVRMGQLMDEQFAPLIDEYEFLTGFRGMGLMRALECDRPSKPFQTLLQERGLLALTTSETLMRFLPPLNITEADVSKAAGIVREACEAWKAQIEAE
jgi:acetylornithine/succinyldiaminopimelate/putrescine aminotransferase